MEWRPILVGERAVHARRVVDEIAAALAVIEPSTPGLAGGAAGMALFFAYHGDVTADERSYEHAVALVERSSALIERDRVDLTWSTGLAGIAWTIDHLSGDSEDDPNRAVDRIFDELRDEDLDGSYDLIGGLVGLATYALARLPREPARRLLARIVGRLEQTAEHHDHACTWHTPAAILPPWQVAVAPNGYYNLGLAHGVPGVISILADIAAADVEPVRARALLDGAVAWLLDQRSTGHANAFASWLTETGASPSPTAWCYGDPGVACALMSAGRALGEPRWQAIACDLARDFARRVASVPLQEAGLCHGALGLALVLDRFFHITDDRDFERAAIAYTERALEVRRPGEAVAGFPTVVERRFEVDAGLLSGAAGVGLALLATCSDVEPHWDRMLLFPR